MPDLTLEQLTAKADFVERVDEEIALLSGFWGAGARDLNTDPGSPLRDLVVTPSAEAGVLNLERVDQCRKEGSLYELVSNPDLASPEAVDRILANHPTLKRRIDSPARGHLALYMPDNTISPVLRNSRFAHGDLVYIAEDTFVCTPGTVTGPSDRLLTPLADGTWVFTIPVVAMGTGAAYNVRAGSEFTWVDTRSKCLKIVADTDFSGGIDPESNAELLQRLDSGLAAPGDAGRMNIHAMLMQRFPFLVDISLIGGGDHEMRRDGRNLLGLKTGGKTDAYVRTAAGVSIRKVELKAEVADAATGLLRLHIGRDIYPGFYDLVALRRSDQTDLDPAMTILERRWSADVENFSYDVPEMREESDYRFTRFQTLTVLFEDSGYDPEKPYVASLLGLPGLGEIQDYVSRRDVRAPNNDMLVKAAIPTLVTAGVTVEYVEAGPAVAEDACREAIERAIHAVRFEHGKLSTSGIVQAVQNILPGTAQVQPPVDLLGITIYPGGEVRTKRTTLELVPDVLAGDVASSRNISFFVSGVGVTLKPVVRLQV